MKRVYGNTGGLKAHPVKRLQNLYRRRIPPEFLITPEVVRDLCRLSDEVRRQIGVLVDRFGSIAYVIVGDQQGVVIPNLQEYRLGSGRLKGLRLIHTHLQGEPLSDDDLTDLALLRLDLIAAVTMSPEALPRLFHAAHLLPERSGGASHQILDPFDVRGLNMGCDTLIRALEAELAQSEATREAGRRTERALLVSVSTGSRQEARDSMAELSELAHSSRIEVAGTLTQHRKKADSRHLLGRGKLRDLTIMALQKGADVVVFDQELNPSQIRAITDRIELKIIDRTQLILDIFAQRAMTREGKLQVELAQLRYMLPRLVGKNTALSRLAGGIGGRGPGETKLEIDRRRVRERIARLERSLSQVQRQRQQQRARRSKKGLPIVSIVGYTNAGKSTLLNTLTKADVLAESRLFATLDPASRRLKFPRDVEVIITDTVGFIRDLPKDLMVAFRATLEELESADILLHVIDASHPRATDQIESVEKILTSLGLESIPVLRVLNKKDLVPSDKLDALTRNWEGIPISALSEESLNPLVHRIEEAVGTMAQDDVADGFEGAEPLLSDARDESPPRGWHGNIEEHF
ncbi:GTPase HflX [Thermodesulfobacteriota bacterium]